MQVGTPGCSVLFFSTARKMLPETWTERTCSVCSKVEVTVIGRPSLSPGKEEGKTAGESEKAR